MRYSKYLRLILGAIVLLFVVVVSWGIYSSIINRGKISVEIKTIPADSLVLIDGKKISSDTIYLKPGTYTFSATKEGFEKDSKDITVSVTRHYVSLTPAPVSDEAKKWAADNQAAYEEIGSRIVEERVNIVEKENPLLAKLPYIDVMGPFSVDFSFSSETSERAYIIIKNATPAGRIRALQWIRGQGVDPADLIIQFEDFNNPTAQGDY